MNIYVGRCVMVVVVVLLVVGQVNTLMNECGISFCSNCDPKTNACNQCDLPYKPAYSNQSVCTRCANNCLVCAAQGTDSSGACLSCQANFDFSKDNHCNTFYIWVYIVVIACYAVFIITIFIIFCWMKKRKERRQNLWFQRLKSVFNVVDSEKVTVLEFDKMCEYLKDLLKESSGFNNLRFRDREYEKAMKIKSVEMKQVDTETHMKELTLTGSDNSEWQGHGYVFIPRDSNSKLKLWFAKNYTRKVHSQTISKVIIYFSQQIQTNQMRGKWYYHNSPEIGGDWVGIKRPFSVDQRQ